MRRSMVSACVVVLLSTLCVATDYTKEVRKCVKIAIGDDFKNYQYFSLPVDNFGTATMYPEAAKGQTFDIKTAGLYGDPGTWWTFNDSQRIATELDKLRPAAKSGPISATCTTNMKFSLSAVLPALFKLLSVNAGVDYNKSVTVQISFSSATYRSLNWTQLGIDDKTHLIIPEVSAHLGAHDFLITIGDVVLQQYSAQLTFKKNLDVNAKAQLTSAWNQFAKDSALTANFTDGSNGTYTLTAKNPVIAAVYVGEPPPGVSLEKVEQKDVNATPLGAKVLMDLATSRPSDLRKQ